VRATNEPSISTAVATGSRPGVGVTAVVAWLLPGGGHALQGQLGKAAVFFGVLVGMFVIGLACGGRLFAVQFSDILVGLAAVSEWMIGLPRVLGYFGGLGAGNVVASTYEYGNTFLIVAGLLNTLVILDACDLAAGRKRA
jgi:hypothetical protein